MMVLTLEIALSTESFCFGFDVMISIKKEKNIKNFNLLLLMTICQFYKKKIKKHVTVPSFFAIQGYLKMQ